VGHLQLNVHVVWEVGETYCGLCGEGQEGLNCHGEGHGEGREGLDYWVQVGLGVEAGSWAREGIRTHLVRHYHWKENGRIGRLDKDIHNYIQSPDGANTQTCNGDTES